PTGYCGVIDRDALDRIGTRGARRICVKPVFEVQSADMRVPELIVAQAANGIFPEEGVCIGLGSTRKRLELGDLRRPFSAVMSARRHGTQLACRGENQRLPGAGHGRIGFAPVHLPGPTGTLPVHLASDPSALPRSMTLVATRRPISRPAATSLGYPHTSQRAARDQGTRKTGLRPQRRPRLHALTDMRGCG